MKKLIEKNRYFNDVGLKKKKKTNVDLMTFKTGKLA